MSSITLGWFSLKKARNFYSNTGIAAVDKLSKKPLTPAYITQTYSSAGIGTYYFYFNN